MNTQVKAHTVYLNKNKKCAHVQQSVQIMQKKHKINMIFILSRFVRRPTYCSQTYIN